MNSDNMQHGYTWQGQDVAGWIATEKFDGIRAYWDGETLWTRGGKAVPLPQEWRDALPSGIHLDGEIYAGPSGQRKCATAARFGRIDESIWFVPFDVPKHPGNYLARISTLRHGRYPIIKPWAHIVESNNHARNILELVQRNGGEGLILRHPELAYAPGRTDQLLKIKTWDIN